LVAEEPASYSAAERQEVRVSRIVRDTVQSRKIKALYDYRCQMCGIRLECPAGPYAEAAHIRPLGAPHDGPDTADNLLCLCPNHHVLFDNGAVSIAEDLSLIGDSGSLTVHRDHRINEELLAYHREHFLVSPEDEFLSS
jgi:putative restriction endonuclease